MFYYDIMQSMRVANPVASGSAVPQNNARRKPFLIAGVGYFFVTPRTPKITTANRLSN